MILSIFIFMIITYLFFVIRNKIFEIVVMGVNFAFFLFSIFIVNDTRIKDSEILKHYHLIGQTYSKTILYSFLGFCHLGFVIGFILFNIDNLKPKIKRLLYEYSGYHSPQGKNKQENVRPSFMSESRDTMTDMESNFTSRTQSMMSSSFYKYDEDSPDYYKNFLGILTPKASPRLIKSCVVMLCLRASVMERIFTSTSDAFSTVCISPKVRSKSSPAAKSPWCAHTVTSYSFIFSTVASAISLPPGTIHFTTPTPLGKITGHSVIVSQSSLVNTSSLSGSTKVSAIRLAGCA